MTGTEDHANTRPISVAELLARNGTIGAPPVGGRRRRRRGDGSITVAELTGEIPVIRDEAPPTEPEPSEPAKPEPEAVAADTEAAEEAPDAEDAPAEPTDQDTDQDQPAEDQDGDEDQADEDLDFFAPPRRSRFARRSETSDAAGAVGAEQMSPDPWPDTDAGSDLAATGADTLFGGPTGTETRTADEDIEDLEKDRDKNLDEDRDEDFDEDLDEDLAEHDGDLDEDAPANKGSAFLHGLWVVAQCLVAVAFGAGLFIAFDQLWQWNSIVALVLGVLVILGLVVGVRVVRKTEDIGSTLIAVAVGALVTFGPLALIQAA
jgi:F0F1-type ATP synthase assembly protein I